MSADIVDKLAASVLELDPLSDYHAFAKEAIEEIKGLREMLKGFSAASEAHLQRARAAEARIDTMREALLGISPEDLED